MFDNLARLNAAAADAQSTIASIDQSVGVLADNLVAATAAFKAALAPAPKVDPVVKTDGDLGGVSAAQGGDGDNSVLTGSAEGQTVIDA